MAGKKDSSTKRDDSDDDEEELDGREIKTSNISVRACSLLDFIKDEKFFDDINMMVFEIDYVIRHAYFFLKLYILYKIVYKNEVFQVLDISFITTLFNVILPVKTTHSRNLTNPTYKELFIFKKKVYNHFLPIELRNKMSTLNLSHAIREAAITFQTSFFNNIQFHFRTHLIQYICVVTGVKKNISKKEIMKLYNSGLQYLSTDIKGVIVELFDRCINFFDITCESLYDALKNKTLLFLPTIIYMDTSVEKIRKETIQQTRPQHINQHQPTYSSLKVFPMRLYYQPGYVYFTTVMINQIIKPYTPEKEGNRLDEYNDDSIFGLYKDKIDLDAVVKKVPKNKRWTGRFYSDGIGLRLVYEALNSKHPNDRPEELIPYHTMSKMPKSNKDDNDHDLAQTIGSDPNDDNLFMMYDTLNGSIKYHQRNHKNLLKTSYRKKSNQQVLYNSEVVLTEEEASILSLHPNVPINSSILFQSLRSMDNSSRSLIIFDHIIEDNNNNNDMILMSEVEKAQFFDSLTITDQEDRRGRLQLKKKIHQMLIHVGSINGLSDEQLISLKEKIMNTSSTKTFTSIDEKDKFFIEYFIDMIRLMKQDNIHAQDMDNALPMFRDSDFGLYLLKKNTIWYIFNKAGINKHEKLRMNRNHYTHNFNRAISTAVNKIQKKYGPAKSNKLIGYGSWAYGRRSHLKHLEPKLKSGLPKKIQELSKYRIMAVDEKYTTRRCSVCKSGANIKFFGKTPKKRTSRYKLVQDTNTGVVQCSVCQKIRNRDVAAAVNIREVTVAVRNNQERPKYLSKVNNDEDDE